MRKEKRRTAKDLHDEWIKDPAYVKAFAELEGKAKTRKKMSTKNTVRIFKVTIPSWLAWPNYYATLKICYDKEDAEKYINTYPNPMLRNFMSIKTEDVPVTETD